MNKSIKKILVTGASLLMLASVGAGVSSTTHASEASAFNRLTNLMGRNRHVRSFRAGADGGYTLRRNGKRITVTMTYASINGHKVSFSKALRAYEHKSSTHHHYHLVRRHGSRKNRRHHARRHSRRHYRRHAKRYNKSASTKVTAN